MKIFDILIWGSEIGLRIIVTPTMLIAVAVEAVQDEEQK